MDGAVVEDRKVGRAMICKKLKWMVSWVAVTWPGTSARKDWADGPLFLNLPWATFTPVSRRETRVEGSEFGLIRLSRRPRTSSSFGIKASYFETLASAYYWRGTGVVSLALNVTNCYPYAFSQLENEAKNSPR